ncbi:MAG: alpha/beta fold hydrolase [Deltaproteobacteria bacterium]|nr:alpha/beta fold hydrolase [Deltaproteobacteria bacterium]
MPRMIDTARGPFELVDEGAGPPVVLLHGFPLHAASFVDDARALAGDMRVLLPSMRGFGASPLGDASSVTIEAMADDVAAILDACGLDGPVVIGGLSMGGYVAMAFARRHARRVRGLVLADTRAEPDSEEARANRDVGIAKVAGGGLVAFVDGLLPKMLGATTQRERPEVVARVRAMATSASPDAVVATLRALRDRPDARPGLAGVAAPTLIVVGAEDALTPPAVADALTGAIPNARVSVIPAAGHMANLENPEPFRHAVRAFVRDVTG